MDLTNDLTLRVLPLGNNDLCFYVTGVGCEIGCAGTTDNILYIRVTCRIKSNINENFKTWILNFLDRNNHLT